MVRNECNNIDALVGFALKPRDYAKLSDQKSTRPYTFKIQYP